MMPDYSLSDRILQLRERGVSYTAIAKRAKVQPSTVKRIATRVGKRWEEHTHLVLSRAVTQLEQERLRGHDQLMRDVSAADRIKLRAAGLIPEITQSDLFRWCGVAFMAGAAVVLLLAQPFKREPEGLVVDPTMPENYIQLGAEGTTVEAIEECLTFNLGDLPAFEDCLQNGVTDEDMEAILGDDAFPQDTEGLDGIGGDAGGGDGGTGY